VRAGLNDWFRAAARATCVSFDLSRREGPGSRARARETPRREGYIRYPSSRRVYPKPLVAKGISETPRLRVERSRAPRVARARRPPPLSVATLWRLLAALPTSAASERRCSFASAPPPPRFARSLAPSPPLPPPASHLPPSPFARSGLSRRGPPAISRRCDCATRSTTRDYALGDTTLMAMTH
jgi:hypothetical protein